MVIEGKNLEWQDRALFSIQTDPSVMEWQFTKLDNIARCPYHPFDGISRVAGAVEAHGLHVEMMRHVAGGWI